MDWFFTSITWLGSLYLLLPLSLLSVFLLLWIGKSEQALMLGLSLFSTIISVHAAKLIFRRPRPAVTDLLVTMPADWSFPSAHTAQATAFFFSITLIAFRLLPLFWAAATMLLSVLVVGSVAYSRVYLQVHYISDVVAGLVLAIFLVAVVDLVIPALPWFGDTGSH